MSLASVLLPPIILVVLLELGVERTIPVTRNLLRVVAAALLVVIAV